jgi:TRAP-type C4-dicarboxylate transport system permease small subunit
VKDRATSLVNNLLTANIFFILLVFGWLLVALSGEALHVNLGWQIWQSLWMPVFQPAISILIAGAIGQWAIGKLFKK